MFARVLELHAWILGLTVRKPSFRKDDLLFVMGLFLFFALIVRENVFFIAVLMSVGFAFIALEDIRRARKQLSEFSPVHFPNMFRSETSARLNQLYRAVDLIRSGHLSEADALLEDIDNDFLTDSEKRLALAAKQRILLDRNEQKLSIVMEALPVHCEWIDGPLGRSLVADAWHHAARLRAIESRWRNRGVPLGVHTTLARLRCLIWIHLDQRAAFDVCRSEARVISEEAELLGDQNLADGLQKRAGISLRV